MSKTSLKLGRIKINSVGCDNMHYILASASPRRQELLTKIVDNFDVIVSNFDEDSVKFNGDVEDYVKTLAEGKGKDVASQAKKDSIIIAADTVVVIDGKILGKPKNADDAYNMLKLLSNKIHRVYSGIAVINTTNNIMKSEAVFTEVKFSELTHEEIINYINSKEPLDKAGAYGIQGLGALFVEKINGCYYNVVGLPLNRLNKIIKEVI
jgi:septum formation protein